MKHLMLSNSDNNLLNNLLGILENKNGNHMYNIMIVNVGIVLFLVIVQIAETKNNKGCHVKT